MKTITRLVALIASMWVLAACPFANVNVAPTRVSNPGTRGATGIELFVYPDDDEQMLLDRIAGARERVFMKMYLLSDFRIIDAMAEAARNGADVRAMVEQQPFGGGATAGQAYGRLQKAGVKTKYTNPAFRFTHEKSFVVDDTGVILTANMTKAAFTFNREFGVYDTDPADVQEMVDSFNADWERAAFQPHSLDLVWSPINSRERINGLIAGAARSLLVYAEVVQDDEQIGLLAGAVKRGVDVCLITSPAEVDASGSNPDHDKLQGGGVRLRYIKNPYIHAKMFVADGTLAFIGSENITANSLDFNRELGILLADPAAIARLQAVFEKDWSRAVDR
jgi:cardiolipin synthase A/B